jgi:hypothetical protein
LRISRKIGSEKQKTTILYFEGVIPIDLKAETGKLPRIGEMDVRLSAELFQSGVRCLPAARSA